MKRLTRFSIRHLIALTIVVALLMPFGIAYYPKVVAFFTPPKKTQAELRKVSDGDCTITAPIE